MEPKKNPKFDVHRQRGVLLNVGLVVSLVLVIGAFKFSVPTRETRGDLPTHDPFADALVIDQPPSTNFNKQNAPKTARIQSTPPLAANIVEIKSLSELANPVIPLPDQGQENNFIDVGVVDIPIETPEPDTFRLVEKMPEPIGGWQAFFGTLQKHIKYPKQAARVHATGKVYIEFTVNTAGQLCNFKVLKGVGYGCDEEATRVLALTKWNAGKQRGRPVNVKLVQPITFSLNNMQ